MKTSFRTVKATVFVAALAVAVSTQAQPFLTNGLIAYYPFDGNANDATTNGHNGTLFGSATFQPDRFGNPNSCLSLPGTAGDGSGVDIPSLSNIPFGPITYSAWFVVNNFPPFPSPGPAAIMALLGRWQPCDQYGGILCINSAPGGTTNQLVYYTGANDYATLVVPPTNQWCQVVFTLDASANPTFYFNGTNVPGSGGAPLGQPLDFRIGATAANGCGPSPIYVWNGLIDDVRIYNRVLSATEVQELYQYEAPPCPSGFAAAIAQVTNGFVVGATVTIGGCGFTNVPQVLIQGGGGTGATATAVVSNGVVTSIDITATGSNYTSIPTIYIGDSPIITTEPQSVTVNAGDATSFSVSAIGADPLAYQWSLNGTNITGASLSCLTFTNVAQTNLGTYAVVITNVFGAATSSPANLNMYPYLVMPFGGLETDWGYTNTLSVGAWGSGPLSYQWFDNGVAIAGATDQSLTFTGIQVTNSGLYTVVVSNAFGTVTNTPEQVVVEPAGVSLGLSPTVTITGVVGYIYTIQRTANLSDTNSWVTVTNLTLTDPVQIWVDTNINTALPGNPMQFYRVLPGQ